MIEAIIFDKDGVLVDTEPLHAQSYRETLAENGVTLSNEEYYEHWTRNGKGIKEFVVQRNLFLDVSTLRVQKRKRYHELLAREIPVIDGVYETVRTLHAHYPLALVTSSYREATDFILDATKLKQYFRTVVTANDVKKEKPDPEGFLLAAHRLNRDPKNVLVIEDAEKGVIAAYRAGMKCIAIPNKYTQNNDFSLASKVISDIKQLTLGLISSL